MINVDEFVIKLNELCKEHGVYLESTENWDKSISLISSNHKPIATLAFNREIGRIGISEWNGRSYSNHRVIESKFY